MKGQGKILTRKNHTATIADIDPWLEPYRQQLIGRDEYITRKTDKIIGSQDVRKFSLGHLYFGLHRTADGWIFREWAPNAIAIYFICDTTDWQDRLDFAMDRTTDESAWELKIPADKLHHLDHYKLHVYWAGGNGERIPSYATYVVQDPKTNIFDAVVWAPNTEYTWQSQAPQRPDEQLIYEAHIGMSGDREAVSTYRQFEAEVLPRIKDLGYNTVQLMAIQEHPYYGSFGYQVSNFYAESSRFGTPDDLKHLIDTAHQMGLRVIMDVVHSHSVKNENEGLGNFAGDCCQYFKPELHSAWDSRLFDYGKPQVMHFLLSNLHFWRDEYHFDGFRFDGVTSMIYHNHGLGQAFTSYDDYFTPNTDLDALTYLSLANELIHLLDPQAVTIAEDMSALPGMAAPLEQGGIGFDYRFNMGAPDLWIKMLKDQRDEDWQMGKLFHELTSHRPEEHTINYAESHDQAMVGDKTIIFRLLDKEMYDHMQKSDQNLIVDRGIALHKMIRLITASTNAGGYLNFMGNEFGHPEWIDFPREGNNWSYKYARRQWSLVDNPTLKFQWLNNFDCAMIQVIKQLTPSEYSYVKIHEDKKLVSYMRNSLLFVYNFSNNSYTDLAINAESGQYHIILSTDDQQFGGYDRVDTAMEYCADSSKQLRLYLPARTALVLKTVK